MFRPAIIYTFNNEQDKGLKVEQITLGAMKNGYLVQDTDKIDFLPTNGKIKISLYKGKRITFQNYDDSEKLYNKASIINFDIDDKIFSTEENKAQRFYIYFFATDVNMLSKVGVVFEPLVCPIDA